MNLALMQNICKNSFTDNEDWRNELEHPVYINVDEKLAWKNAKNSPTPTSLSHFISRGVL